MDSWKQKLRQASFKGIPFYIEAISGETGRRGHLHEYPNRNTAYFEDMGKKTTLQNIEAFVIGDNYLENERQLIEACGSCGVGVLVHPFHGNFNVVCTNCAYSLKSSEMGISRLTLSFTETDEIVLPVVSEDFKDKLLSLSNTTNIEINSNFLNKFNIEGLSSDVINSIGETIKTFANKALDALDFVNSKIDDAQNIADGKLSIVDSITNVALKMSDTLNNAVSLLKTPEAFMARISALYDIISSFSNPMDAIRSIKNVSNLNVAKEIEKIDINSKKGQREAENKQQLELLCQRAGIVSQANIISSMEFKSSKEAEEILNDFINQVEEQILTKVSTDENTLQSLKDLRSVLIKDITTTIKKLPEVKIIKIPQSIPSVVLAYELYGDIDRADEIIKRNNIFKPGFMPAMVELEVLSV